MVKDLKPKLIGDKIVIKCPFHMDRSPSFVLKTASETFQCVGCRVTGTFGELWEKLDKPKKEMKHLTIKSVKSATASDEHKPAAG